MNETELLRILGGLVTCVITAFGLILRATLQRLSHSDRVIETHIHTSTQAMQTMANGFNRMADVIGNCEEAQLARRERDRQGRIPPIPQIVPKMTGD